MTDEEILTDPRGCDFTKDDRACAEQSARTMPWIAKLLVAHDLWRQRAFAAVRETQREIQDHTRRLRERIEQFDLVEADMGVRAKAAEATLERIRALVPVDDPLQTVVNASALRAALGPLPPPPRRPW